MIVNRKLKDLYTQLLKGKSLAPDQLRAVLNTLVLIQDELGVAQDVRLAALEAAGGEPVIALEFSISSVNILNLHTTPVPLRASPGAGILLYITKYWWEYTHVSIPYTGSGNLQFRYTDTTNMFGGSLVNYLTAADSISYNIAVGAGDFDKDSRDLGIELHFTGQQFDGDGTVELAVEFSTYTSPF